MREEAWGQPPYIAERLAEFACRFSFDQIPPAVLMHAKWLMLDAVGLAFASSQYAFADRALSALEEFEPGESVVIGYEQKLGLRDATLLNGTLIHGLDYDDTYFPGSMHISASCVPTALGVAARKQASGKDFLTALVLGLEIGVRLSAAGKGGFIRAGFHATGILGAMTSTLVAGSLMRLDARQLVMAQGIALSMASGTMQPVHEGVWSKRLHPGLAGASAITAVALAKHGFIGPEQTYEGRSGAYRKFLGEHFKDADLDLVTQSLGERWETVRTSFKLFPACHQSHAFLNAALALRRKHDLQPDQIEGIQVLVASAAIPLICEPIDERRKPSSSYAAQFSLPYGVACCLVRGRFTLNEIDESSYSDPVLLALAQKVDYEIDPKSGFPAFRSGEVIVRTKDGRILRERGELFPDEAPSQAQVVAKFNQNARLAMPESRATEICRTILAIEDIPNIREFSGLLRGEKTL